MAKNAAQIFPSAGDIQWATTPLVTANTTRDGTSGTLYTVYTAGADGCWVINLTFQPLGSNPASVVRVWINNGSSTGTAANNTLVSEVELPVSVASEIVPLPSVVKNFTAMLAAGYKIFCTLGTAGTAGWQSTCFGQTYTV